MFDLAPTVPCLVMPHFDPAQRTLLAAPIGSTIEDIMVLALPGLPDTQRELVRVTIGDYVILHDDWRLVRPKPGARVLIRVVPAGDVGKAALNLLVVVAAIAIAGPLAGALGFTGIGLSIATTVATVGLVTVGTLLVNSLIPVRPPTLSDTTPGSAASSPTYGVQGLRNSANPNGPVPDVHGKNRLAPVYVALPYTETIGDDQFVIVAFTFGFGPIAMTEHKLGDTPIESFQDVQFETRQGYPGDLPLTLYTQQVFEDALSIDLTNEDGPVSRVGAADTTEASVEFSFASGLYQVDGNGTLIPLTVSIRIRERPVGTSTWTEVTTLDITAAQQKNQLRRGYRWSHERGTYEIECFRLTPSRDADNNNSDKCQWSVMRGIRPEYPINFEKPLALVAMRIKATGQLNGVIDNYNAIVSRIAPDYDAGTDTWITRETQSPAASYRRMLQGPALPLPKADVEIDLDGLAEWSEFCRSRDLKYNRIHDFAATFWDSLSDACAVGRATPHDKGDTLGVVVDQIKTLVVSHLTPRNSWNFSGERSYVDYPDAYRVPFKDETNGFADAEMTVPWPGFEGDPQVVEQLEHPGITDPVLIWKETRRRQYEVMHRPDTYTTQQNIEGLETTRGDLCMLNHDVLDREQIAARVKSITGGTVLLDEFVRMKLGETYAVRFRLSDGSTLRCSVDNTTPGRRKSIRVVGDMSAVAVGDLAQFGTTVRGEAFEAIVRGVEMADNDGVRLTLQDHAPQIETLTDAELMPAWDGRIGFILPPSALAPAIPSITAIHNGAPDSNALVLIAVGSTSGSPTAAPETYGARHRVVGAPTWNADVVVPVAAGAANISGYSDGDTIEVQVRAISANAVPSLYSGSTEYVVGSEITPQIATFSAVQDPDTLVWRFDWTIAAPGVGQTLSALAGVRIREADNIQTNFNALAPLHTGLLTASPWLLNAVPTPGGGVTHITFGIVTQTTNGAIGTPVLIHVTL